jgi:hypothetical protein
MADYRAIARQKARKYGLPPSVFVRQIKQESGFNPRARSPAGAQGIAQIMPATARGWGVNPNDPVASLDAAAKNMAQYVRKYGSYENALRAYNAGPAAIQKSKGYAETNKYVQNILQGKSPKTRKEAVKALEGLSARDGGVSLEDTTRQQTSFDEKGYETARRRAVLGNFIAKRNPQSFLVRSGVLGTTAPNAADFTETKMIGGLKIRANPNPRRGSSSPSSRGSGSGGGGAKGTLRELFYNGPGGVNVDDGKRVPKGYVSAHTEHVHAAADNDADRVWLEVRAKKRGLTVTSEGGGGHAPGSFHYQRTKRGRSKGIDVSGDPAAMAAYSRDVARYFGVSGGRRRRR